MSLTQTTVSSFVQTGETNMFGNVTPPPENFTHQTASINTPLVNGTSAGQANHSVELLLSCGTGGVTLDLTATGALTGLDGKNRDFSNGGSGGNIKDILLENLDPTNTITITQGSNGWTGISGAATGLNKPIPPGGHIHIYDPTGLAVSSTNNGLTFTGSAGTPQLKATIVGVAA